MMAEAAGKDSVDVVPSPSPVAGSQANDGNRITISLEGIGSQDMKVKIKTPVAPKGQIDVTAPTPPAEEVKATAPKRLFEFPTALPFRTVPPTPQRALPIPPQRTMPAPPQRSIPMNPHRTICYTPKQRMAMWHRITRPSPGLFMIDKLYEELGRLDEFVQQRFRELETNVGNLQGQVDNLDMFSRRHGRRRST